MESLSQGLAGFTRHTPGLGEVFKIVNNTVHQYKYRIIFLQELSVVFLKKKSDACQKLVNKKSLFDS